MSLAGGLVLKLQATCASKAFRACNVFSLILHSHWQQSNVFAGVSAIPESSSGELRALESGTLTQSGVEGGPEVAELGTQTSTSLEETTPSVA